MSLSVDDKRVFRFHFVDYQFEDEPENKHSLQVSGDAYEQLQARGLAEVKQGAFGWSWVQSIKPRP